jgi:hypothetical protein
VDPDRRGGLRERGRRPRSGGFAQVRHANPYDAVGDVYVYDENGRLLENVRLFDQEGRPIDLGWPTGASRLLSRVGTCARVARRVRRSAARRLAQQARRLASPTPTPSRHRPSPTATPSPVPGAS